ncbi:hypothetical protein WOLCODRAFT_134851, partial [Wolfiporia cocos MD-104 SS10]
ALDAGLTHYKINDSSAAQLAAQSVEQQDPRRRLQRHIRILGARGGSPESLFPPTLISIWCNSRPIRDAASSLPGTRDLSTRRALRRSYGSHRDSG